MTRKACSVSRAAAADLIFNLTESHAGDDSNDVNVAAFLDLLEMRYTGAALWSARGQRRGGDPKT
jgi:hypothetical protein